MPREEAEIVTRIVAENAADAEDGALSYGRITALANDESLSDGRAETGLEEAVELGWLVETDEPDRYTLGDDAGEALDE